MKFQGLSVASKRDNPLDICKDRTYPALSIAEDELVFKTCIS